MKIAKFHAYTPMIDAILDANSQVSNTANVNKISVKCMLCKFRLVFRNYSNENFHHGTAQLKLRVVGYLFP